MLQCGNNWQPIQIDRFIESKRSSTKVMLVKTDRGVGYLKAMGNPHGSQALACELVGTELAAWFGLPTLDFALINVTQEIELPFDNNSGIAQPGPAFITREAKQSIPWGGGSSLLSKISNSNDITKLAIFDTWIMNFDRYPPESSLMEPNLDNYLFVREPAPRHNKHYRLLATDHTHCFVEGDLWNDIHDNDLISIEGIYGLPEEFRPYINIDDARQSISHLEQLDRATVEEIVSSVPREWGITNSIFESWTELIYERARFVADHMPQTCTFLDQPVLL